MTAAEKARELIDKFTTTIWESGNTVSKPMIKKCALIAVEELIKTHDDFFDYWQNVKSEIEKL